jgi:acetyl-CoA carboxylase biotin carboxylase subunit
MFKKILIANRGEIALRIQRACRELGIKSVVVYSEADRDAKYVKLADEAVCIGPPAARESYLDVRNVIGAAEVTGCDAVHPGYGFLSENPEFATECANNGIRFVGPAPEVMARMGDKIQAKEAAVEAGLPVLGGSEGGVTDVAAAMAAVKADRSCSSPASRMTGATLRHVSVAVAFLGSPMQVRSAPALGINSIASPSWVST